MLILYHCKRKPLRIRLKRWLKKLKMSWHNRQMLSVLLVTGAALTAGCQSSHTLPVPTPCPKQAIQSLYSITLPQFPRPHPKLVDELKTLCPKNDTQKCVYLYDYLGKIMVFEKKLKIYREGMLKDA